MGSRAVSELSTEVRATITFLVTYPSCRSRQCVFTPCYLYQLLAVTVLLRYVKVPHPRASSVIKARLRDSALFGLRLQDPVHRAAALSALSQA